MKARVLIVILIIAGLALSAVFVGLGGIASLDASRDDLTGKSAAIETIKNTILSGESYSVWEQTIQEQVDKNNLKPFAELVPLNLKQEYEHGEEIAFDVAAFGYVNWCLMPQVQIFHEGYRHAVFEDEMIHRCPPPFGDSSPSAVLWRHDDFKEIMLCQYEGDYTIMGTVYMFEQQQIGQFHCNGDDEFVTPEVHHMIIQDDENSERQLRMLPDTVVAKEGDIFQFTNDSDEEFWLVAKHDSDSDLDLILHFDPGEFREFNKIKSGTYSPSVDIDDKPIQNMSSRIIVEK